MKTRLLLLITLLSLMVFGFACGGVATNSNGASNANVNKVPLAMSNMTTNSTSTTVTNTTSNSTTTNSTSVTTNPAANKTNSVANKMAPLAKAMDTDDVPPSARKPKGATAQCKDGTYSMSKTDSGQCSGHGGVDKKF